jgi:hypothetical protein
MKAKQELQRLKDAKLPRLDWRELAKVREGEKLPDADEKAMAEYFAHFVKPGPCICCGAQQGSKDLMDAFIGGGRFRWGIAHGEGNCTDCGWPARAYHRNVGPIEFVQIILQFHPDELNVREPETA